MEYTQKQIAFANELADALNDREAIASYRILVATYSEDHLRKKLAHVLKLEDHQIRKTRGALFTFLVKQDASSFNRPRN